MLKEKIALVTGASRGIGREIALKMAAEGAYVIVNYSGSQAAAKEVVETIQAAGGNGMAYQCNVSDFEQVKQMIADITKEHKRLDILVNNAGITQDTLLLAMKEADFDSVIEINLKGAFNCCRHAARQMLKQRSGRIINISSVVGRMGNAGQANYAASKAGIIGLTKAAARELGSRGITVNAIAPGYIETEMTQGLPDAQREQIKAQTALGTLGKTEDVAALVLFLASDQAGYITGQTIGVDGGMCMQ